MQATTTVGTIVVSCGWICKAKVFKLQIWVVIMDYVHQIEAHRFVEACPCLGELGLSQY